jgi:hypothetical protein
MRQGGKMVHIDQTVDAQMPVPPPTKPPMQRKDYPKIDFWYLKQYKALKDEKPKGGRGRNIEGENVMFRFLQDETGQVLEGKEVDAICEASRHFWRVLYQDYDGNLGCPWREVDARAQLRFYEEIEEQYPLLKFCEGHWKARSICTNGYSQWHSTYSKKQISIKCNSEEATLSDSDSQAVCPAKRSSEAPPRANSNKRARSKSSKHTIYLF